MIRSLELKEDEIEDNLKSEVESRVTYPNGSMLIVHKDGTFRWIHPKC